MEDKNKKLNEIITQENLEESIDKNIDFLIETIPEIKNMIGFEHRHPHHIYDVWNHTKVAMKNSNPDLEIRMALLFHDIGKPFSYQDEEVRHFHGHPEVSNKMTEKILKRLNYDDEFIKRICYLVQFHDTIIDMNEIDIKGALVLKRLEVQYADAKAHNPTKVQKRIDILDRIKEELEQKLKGKSKEERE